MIFPHLETSDVIYCSDRFSELSLNMLVSHIADPVLNIVMLYIILTVFLT